MQAENFEKIITVNDLTYENIRHCVDKLLFLIFKENVNPHVEYFKLRLKDSEKSPFAKDLLLEWVCLKQPERLNPENAKIFKGKLYDEIVQDRLENGYSVCDSLNTMET